MDSKPKQLSVMTRGWLLLFICVNSMLLLLLLLLLYS